MTGSANVRVGESATEAPRNDSPWRPRVTFGLIAVPMVTIVLVMRLYSHLIQIRHIHVAGFLVHHLFQGVFLVIPAAFVLAFRPRRKLTSATALAALGVGSGMILDEMTYMVMTQASDADYVSAVSLVGSIVFMSAGLAVLLFVFRNAASRCP